MTRTMPMRVRDAMVAAVDAEGYSELPALADRVTDIELMRIILILDETAARARRILTARVGGAPPVL